MEEEQKTTENVKVEENKIENAEGNSADGQIIEPTDAEKEDVSINEFYHILEDSLKGSISKSTMGAALLKQIQGGNKTV